MKNLCKNCKWWYIDDHSNLDAAAPRDPTDEYGWEYVTNPDKQEELFGHATQICHSPKLKKFIRPERGEASVVDGSEYMATLITSSDFGCNNFEKGTIIITITE